MRSTKGKKLIIALDVDDTLFPCLPSACEYVGIDPARITDWDLSKTDLSQAERNALMLAFNNEEFLNEQEPYPGAVDMVNTLIDEGHEVIIASAIAPSAMTTRSNCIKKFFPRIPEKNIMLGAQKHLLTVDFLLDDNPGNLTGNAKYAVLFTAAHNQYVKGYMRANSYDEFMSIVQRASAATPDSSIANVTEIGRPGILCLVGPSGSGKSIISDELEKNPLFKKIRCITDRPPREGEINGEHYNFVSEEQFQKAVEGKKLIESTTFRDGFHYGIAEKEIKSIWNEGCIAIKAIDASGAKAIKDTFPDRAVLVFIRRDKRSVLNAILESDTTNEDKVNRILSIDESGENEAMCDYTLYNNGSLEHAVEQILHMI